MILRKSIKRKIGFRLPVVTALVAALICTWFQSASAQTGGAANYFYDANGRLTAVLSPTGEAAIYNYDPAGNFTSITRRTANEISVIDFTPGAGGIGTSVTIYGTGFLTTPLANTVKFNGVTATVSAATKTQLTVSVPVGATTGPINISNANGSVTSSGSFFVSGNVEFSLPINFGESVQFAFNVPPSGQPVTNVGMLTFNGVVGQRVSLFLDDDRRCGDPDPFATPLAQVSLISPSGAIVTTVLFEGHFFPGFGTLKFAYMDALTLPATGTYTILIDPINDPKLRCSDGALRPFGATARLYDVPQDAMRTIAASGAATILSFSAPGQNAILTFDGFNGQRIALRSLQSVTTIIGTDIKIYSPGAYPNGTPITSQTLNSSSFTEPLMLTAGGAYTIFVDHQFNKTSDVTLYLYDVLPDIAGAITVNGTSVSANISIPGQNAGYSFSIGSSQALTINLLSNTFSDPITGVGYSPTLSIVNSSGATVFSTSVNVPAGSYAVPSLSPGNYTLKIDPTGPSVGTMSLRLTNP